MFFASNFYKLCDFFCDLKLVLEKEFLYNSNDSISTDIVFKALNLLNVKNVSSCKYSGREFRMNIKLIKSAFFALKSNLLSLNKKYEGNC